MDVSELIRIPSCSSFVALKPPKNTSSRCLYVDGILLNVIDVADAESDVEEINAYIAVDALIVMYDRPDVALDCADTICPFVP